MEDALFLILSPRPKPLKVTQGAGDIKGRTSPAKFEGSHKLPFMAMAQVYCYSLIVRNEENGHKQQQMMTMMITNSLVQCGSSWFNSCIVLNTERETLC